MAEIVRAQQDGGSDSDAMGGNEGVSRSGQGDSDARL